MTTRTIDILPYNSDGTGTGTGTGTDTNTDTDANATPIRLRSNANAEVLPRLMHPQRQRTGDADTPPMPTAMSTPLKWS